MAGGDGLVLAGFVLIEPTPRPQDVQSLPESILTISDCIMRSLPQPEFWDWFTRFDEAEAARLSESASVEIMAVAMTPTDSAAFMAEQGGREQPYFELLRTDAPIGADATVLGYEVVGAEWSLDFHSWHCHGYATEVQEQLDVTVNDLGLIATYDQASRVLTWMLERPPTEAPEPVEWTIVALVREPHAG